MLFDAVVAKDHEALIKLYAANARNSLISYLSMKSRWAQQQERYTKAEEKLDEFQQPSDGSERGRSSPKVGARKDEDASLNQMLQELSGILTGAEKSESTSAAATCPVKISRDAERLLWETSSALSDSRPPADLCVYTKEGDVSPRRGHEQVPPIFDGSVANSTPPALGGASAGASGGAGTILHLACAMDLPLVLAFLLSMGADGRASHTAFRRLMIHEAACNGSIDCLTLLLEMGKKYSKAADTPRNEASMVPFFPSTLAFPGTNLLTNADPSRSVPPIGLNVRHFRRENKKSVNHRGDYLLLLRKFKALSTRVKNGELSQLEAGRELLDSTTLVETTRASLVRSCAFKKDTFSSRTFIRPHGCADGHGNTPLHWAAFKNETKCVSLLLDYEANPNARAHPSGWTPLHDAAYSNSSESIELLIAKGAKVDARANSGATPLCFAAQEDAAAAARLLLEKGADLTARCAGAPHEDGQGVAPIHPHSRFSGYTPLHYCAHYNAHKASQVLLAHHNAKSAMETPDLSGRLPIHVAVARGSSDVLRELLHAGARIDIRPSNGMDTTSPRAAASPNAFFALPDTPARRPPVPEEPFTPNPTRPRSRSSTASPVTSPVLRSMIPQEPITSTKPWNCLTQKAIDECKDLISKAEQSWSPDRHLLFTPQDRKAVMELLRVGKRLEQQGVLFVDLWPQVLGFCGRGWFEPEGSKPRLLDYAEGRTVQDVGHPDSEANGDADDYLALPSLSN